MPKWFVVLFFILSSCMTLVSFLGFLGWVSDPSPNKWGALFCFVMGLGATLFFRHLLKNPKVLESTNSSISKSQQSSLVATLLTFMLLPFGRNIYQGFVGKPNSTLDYIGEFAAYCAVSYIVFGVTYFFAKKSER